VTYSIGKGSPMSGSSNLPQSAVQAHQVISSYVQVFDQRGQRTGHHFRYRISRHQKILQRRIVLQANIILHFECARVTI
jgi:hypothetical protein